MSEIFISYAREDLQVAQRLAEALAGRGWTVFWDRHIPIGRRFDDVIAEHLAQAKCVVALWSMAASRSDWVLDEAQEARERNILAPARLEEVDPPMGFRQIQAADLIGWRGEESHEGFRQLINDLARFVPPPELAASQSVTPEFESKSAATQASQESTGRNSKRAIMAIAVSIGILPLAVVLILNVTNRHSSDNVGGMPPPSDNSQPSIPAPAKIVAGANAQDTHTYEGEIRLALKARLNEPLSIGSTVNIPLGVAYDGLPRQSRIYVHLMTLAGDKWVTTDKSEFSGSGLRFWFTGGITDAKSSLFGFSNQNYPISKLLDKDLLQVLAKNLLSADELTAKEFANSISNTDNGYDLTLAFLATTGDKTSSDTDANLLIKVPPYSTYYDGILIAPFVFGYDSKNEPFVYVASKNMKPLRLSVKPNRPRPVAKGIYEVSASDLRGLVTLTEYQPQELVIGRSNSVKVKVRVNYKDLVPGTAVYVAAIPFDKGRYIFGQYPLTLPAIQGAVVPTLLQGRSQTYGFAVENRPIQFMFAVGQMLEAGLVGTVVNGGSGVLDGTGSFSPPAYVNKYERVHLMPVLLVPTGSGNRVLIESDRLLGPKVLVSGAP